MILPLSRYAFTAGRLSITNTSQVQSLEGSTLEKRRERKHIVFTPHAKEKIARLHHLGITEGIVNTILSNPQKVETAYLNRKIAQGVLGERHVIRVVFEEMNNMMLVITVYPAGRRRYSE